MLIDREEEREEELPTPQAHEVYVVDAAFINFRSVRERQAYTLIKDRTSSRKQVWTTSSIPFGKL
jgi:hypothetical protein